MSRLDILALPAATLNFSLAAAVDQVAVNLPAAGIFENVALADQFDPGENVILRRIIPHYPYGFMHGLTTHTLQLDFWINNAIAVQIPELGTNSRVRLGNFCDPIELDLFIQAPSTSLPWAFRLGAITASVSMVNLPPFPGGGSTFNPNYYLVVEHTTNMV